MWRLLARLADNLPSGLAAFAARFASMKREAFMVKRPHEYAGLGATLIALLVLAGALAIIGAVVWLKKAPSGAPTQPSQVTKPHSELRYPVMPPAPSEYAVAKKGRAAIL